MDLITLGIQLLGGAVGGNIVGQLAKNLSLGFLGNTVAGLVGGGVGSYALQALGVDIPPINPSAVDPGALLGQIATGGAGGGILMMIVGAIRGMLNK